MTQITEMKGMTPKRVTAFHAVGIHTAKQLLEVGATPLGRLKLADETCLGLAEIEQYVHQADLCRICDIARLMLTYFITRVLRPFQNLPIVVQKRYMKRFERSHHERRHRSMNCSSILLKQNAYKK